jgi:hypothetical protein
VIGTCPARRFGVVAADEAALREQRDEFDRLPVAPACRWAPPVGVAPVERGARKELRFIAFSSAGTAPFRFIRANYAAEEDTAQIASPCGYCRPARQARPNGVATDGNGGRGDRRPPGGGGIVVLKQDAQPQPSFTKRRAHGARVLREYGTIRHGGTFSPRSGRLCRIGIDAIITIVQNRLGFQQVDACTLRTARLVAAPNWSGRVVPAIRIRGHIAPRF